MHGSIFFFFFLSLLASLSPALFLFLCRFEIKKKLKKAKKEQKKSKPALDASLPTISERSKERRKHIEQRKDNKKTSAFQDLKARREEQKKKGKWHGFFLLILSLFDSALNVFPL